MKNFINVKLDHNNNIIDIIRKPKTIEACMSSFCIIGQMIVGEKIISLLDKDWRNQEADIFSILSEYIKTNLVLSLPIKGQFVTVGDPEHFLKANIVAYFYEGKNLSNLKNFIDLLEKNNNGYSTHNHKSHITDQRE